MSNIYNSISKIYSSFVKKIRKKYFIDLQTSYEMFLLNFE